MSGPNSYFTVVLLVAVAFATATNTARASSKKMAHLHFYMHGQPSGPNPTSAQVVTGPTPIPILPRLHFGDIRVFDAPLTTGPGPDSSALGRGQGFYPVVSHDKPVFLMVLNVVLTAGEYNGSTLAIVGGDDIFASVRELSVIGGTGQFRMASGYVIWKTEWYNITSGDTVLELDIYATKTKAH